MTSIEQMMIDTVSYSISFDGKVLFCRWCGRASSNPSDVENRYCDHCHLWHDNVKLEEHLKSL